MKIEFKEGKAIFREEIKEGDVFYLENGNIKIINMILSDGTYKCTIIDPEEQKYSTGIGDFKLDFQNENMVSKMEEY